MIRSLPGPAKVLLGVRVLNQVGAFALAFLAIVAGPGLVTAALTIFGAAALISRWAGGVLLDRASPRALLTAGLAASGLALLALAAARTPAQTLAAVAATGLAFELYEPATSELLARVTEGDPRREAYALLGTSLTAAGAVSGVLAAVLLPVGVRWLLVVDSATCLAAAAIALAGLPREPRGPHSPRRAVRDARWRPPRVLVRLTATATAYAFGSLAILLYLPLVLLQRGAPAWLPGLALAAGALLTPLAARRPLSGRPRAALLAAAALALAMALTGNVVLTVIVYLAMALAGGALLGHWPAVAADRAPVPDRPRWFAFIGLSWGVAQPVVPGAVRLVTGLAHGAGGTSFAPPVVAAAAFAVALLLRPE